jgi:flotillin
MISTVLLRSTSVCQHIPVAALSRCLSTTIIRSLPQLFNSHKRTNPTPMHVTKRTFIPALPVAAIAGIPLGLFGIVGSYYLNYYHVARPNQYIAKTGIFVKDIEISKQTLQLPLQTITTISLEPSEYTSKISAMSEEKIAFDMPVVLTIGPKDDFHETKQGLIRFAKLGSIENNRIIDGIIQGECRILAAASPLEKLFNDREHFKDEIIDKINAELDKIGLTIYNANIKELEDSGTSSGYFKDLRVRALEYATNQAKVATAEHKSIGDKGEASFQADAKQRIAEIEKVTKLIQNDRAKEIAESEAILKIAKAKYEQQVKIAEAESFAASEERKWVLQKEVEEKRKQQEIAHKQAEDFAPVVVQAEITVRTAEAAAVAKKIKAEADFYASQQEAMGIKAIFDAKAEGLKKMVVAAGGVDGLSKYMILENDVLPKLAEKQAEAFKGMNPKFNIWNTTSSSSGGSKDSITNTVSDLLKSGVPLLEQLKDQTGYDFLSVVTKGKSMNEEILEISKAIEVAKSS